MKIGLKEMEAEIIPKFKDGEGEFIAKIQFDGVNRIIYGTLPKGSTIGYHKHDTNSEIIYILDGNGKCLFDDTEEVLSAGDCHYCPKGHSHSLINNSDADLTFFAVVPEQ